MSVIYNPSSLTKQAFENIDKKITKLAFTAAQNKLRIMMMAGEINSEKTKCANCSRLKKYDQMAIDLECVIDAITANDLKNAFCCKACMELSIEDPKPGKGKIHLA